MSIKSRSRLAVALALSIRHYFGPAAAPEADTAPAAGTALLGALLGFSRLHDRQLEKLDPTERT